MRNMAKLTMGAVLGIAATGMTACTACGTNEKPPAVVQAPATIAQTITFDTAALPVYDGYRADTTLADEYLQFQKTGDASVLLGDLRTRMEEKKANPAEYIWFQLITVLDVGKNAESNPAECARRIRESDSFIQEGLTRFPDSPNLLIRGAPRNDTGIAQVEALKGRQTEVPDYVIDLLVAQMREHQTAVQKIEEQRAARKDIYDRKMQLLARQMELHRQLGEIPIGDPRRVKIREEFDEVTDQLEDLE